MIGTFQSKLPSIIITIYGIIIFIIIITIIIIIIIILNKKDAQIRKTYFKVVFGY